MTTIIAIVGVITLSACTLLVAEMIKTGEKEGIVKLDY